MIERDAVKAAQALEKAAEALQKNLTADARRWAMMAASLNPDLETPWLILASISKPHASLAYFQRALEINPAKSQKGSPLGAAKNPLRKPLAGNFINPTARHHQSTASPEDC